MNSIWVSTTSYENGVSPQIPRQTSLYKSQVVSLHPLSDLMVPQVYLCARKTILSIEMPMHLNIAFLFLGGSTHLETVDGVLSSLQQ